MPKSLSEMKSSPDVGRPERTFPICLSGKLISELEVADRDLFAAQEALDTALAAREAAQREWAQGRDAEANGGRPMRLGQRPNIPEVDEALVQAANEAAAACDAIRARMAEHTIDLLAAPVSNTVWRQWVARHPARDPEVDPTGYQRDETHAALYCNVDELIENLGAHIRKYGDEDPTDDSWSFVAANAANGDLTRLASMVVGMQEQVVDLGKSRRAWLDSRKSALDSQ